MWFAEREGLRVTLCYGVKVKIELVQISRMIAIVV